MFNNIDCLPSYDEDTTRALGDGPEVRYHVLFHAQGDGSRCSVSCAVYHAGESRAVAMCGTAYVPGKVHVFNA